jgi:hypothetical protein
VLAGDLHASQAAAARIFGDAIDNIAKTGDGDDFMASMRRLKVALFLSGSAVGIILCLAYRKSANKRDRPPIVTVGVPAIDTSLPAASANVPFTEREPLSQVRLLHRVLGVSHRPKHAVCETEQAPTVRLEACGRIRHRALGAHGVRTPTSAGAGTRP